MFKGISSLVAGFTKTVTKLFGTQYQQISLPIEISLKVESKSNSLTKPAELLSVNGQTLEMSQNEISFVVPFVRIGEHYLAGHGEQKRLKVSFELPNSRVRMTVVPVRYEMINLHDSVQQYLITSQIIQANEADLMHYNDFLKHKDLKLTQNSVATTTKDQKTSTVSVLSN